MGIQPILLYLNVHFASSSPCSSLCSLQELDTAKAAFVACQTLILRHFPLGPPAVQLRGLDTFPGHRVLFSSVFPGEGRDRLTSFVNELSDVFRQRVGAADRPDQNEWKPHVTVAKTSRQRGRRAEWKLARIEPSAYASVPEQLTDLGEHTLLTLELCAMAGIDDDGYYRRIAVLPMGAGGAVPQVETGPTGDCGSKRERGCNPPSDEGSIKSPRTTCDH